ncbi:MAG: LLM class F420-dependent oxidoreductase [Thermomicrobiales bacterium]
MAIKFGVFVPQGWRMDLVEIEDAAAKYEAMTEAARVADRTAFDSIWVYDHFHTVPTPEMEATFECWTISATLARDTKRINIGQMVGCNGYRNPALYAKIASTVDVASNGRLYAGLGAGWYEEEWKAYGYPWWETKERMQHFREAVEIVHKMWTEDAPVYSGRHYSIDKPINEPKGVRKPHPPLWLGGGGEKVTLKLVAQYGDACNVGGDMETIAHKLDVLKGHCEDVGRDPSTVINSSTIAVHLIEAGADPEQATAKTRGPIPFAKYAEQNLIGTIDDVKKRVEALRGVGIDYVLFYVARVAYEPELITRMAEEVIPEFS